MDYIELVVAALLLAANAFFVLVEFALVKARITRLEELANKGYANARIAKELVGQLDDYLSATQLGITMASIGLGWIGEPALARIIRPWIARIPIEHSEVAVHTVAFIIAFAFITFLHVVAGELAPKSIAIRHAEKSAMYTARPMRWFFRIFRWPLHFLTKVSNALLRLLRVPLATESELNHSEEELRMLISHAEEHGQFPLRRLLLFENLFDFGDQKVKDVMTRRDEVAFLHTHAPWEDSAALMKTKHFSRFPLSPDGLDQAGGYVHMKDVAHALARQPAPVDLSNLKRELGSVPDDTPLDKALATFQNRRIPMALVRDHAGKVTGLVTLEDILEELTDEIQDEFEAPPSGTLLDFFVPQAADLDLGAVDRVGAISKLLQGLAGAVPDVQYKEAFELLMKRETALTTAIGSEVALPHARLPNLAKPLLVIGRSNQGIAFEAPDKRPVKLLFMILTPAREPLAQLRLLAKIAALVSNRALHRRLKKARTTTELTEILKAFDSTMPA